MDKDISHRDSSLCETHGGGGIRANPSAVTVWSQHLAPVKCVPHIVIGGVSPPEQQAPWNADWWCHQASAQQQWKWGAQHTGTQNKQAQAYLSPKLTS